jgi:GH15 family glucan-1,4-alpha-glucosidase
VSYLYRPEAGRFARTVKRPHGSSHDWIARADYDTTVDASLFAVWYFGVLDTRDPMVESTMRAVRERLWCATDVGGLARYEGDGYYRSGAEQPGVAGNPWFVCTLWLAQYEIALAKDLEGLKGALDLIEWVVSHALRSGVLAEQVDPRTGDPLSVSPLTWSHAQLVTAVVEYLHRLRELKLCDTCGQPAFDYIRRETGVVPARMDDYPGKVRP